MQAQLKNMVTTANARVFAVVASCFLLTSTGYLVWLYRLMAAQVAPESIDLLSMVIGYAFQAAGVGLYAALLSRRPTLDMRRFTLGAMAVYLICLIAVILGESLAGILTFGYAANLLCGVIAAYYLHCLAGIVPENRRGTVFGCGYAIASLGSWLLSLPFEGMLLQSAMSLAVLLALDALAVATIMAIPQNSPLTTSFAANANNPDVGHDNAESASSSSALDGTPPASMHTSRALLVLASFTVIAICLVKGLGDSFPTADLEAGVSLEFSRLFYAVGLVIAGVISDRDRRVGMACCIAALAMPFISLSLEGAPLPSLIMWCLGYFLFGFFAVFRVILFSDLASRSGRMELSGWGLAFGRVGDTLGVGICLLLTTQKTALVVIAALLFAASVILALQLHQRLYATAAVREQEELRAFEAFCARYELSAREREVLRCLLDEKSNPQIATELFISENTVKFHVRNLLKKTDCKNRVELRGKYTAD